MSITLNEALQAHSLFEAECRKALKRQVVAFDLDHTLIDSSHRTRFNENGKLDLQYWRDHSTWEHIQKDQLLPLYFNYYAFKKAGYTIIAVTARQMSEHDYRYLKENGLDFDLILERGDSEALDHELKDGQLHKFLSEEGRIPFLFYDDKDDNLAVAAKHGFQPMKAQLWNLKAVVKSQYSIRNIDDSIQNFAPKEEDLATKIRFNR